jgi:hypothetical protein
MKVVNSEYVLLGHRFCKLARHLFGPPGPKYYIRLEARDPSLGNNNNWIRTRSSYSRIRSSCPSGVLPITTDVSESVRGARRPFPKRRRVKLHFENVICECCSVRAVHIGRELRNTSTKNALLMTCFTLGHLQYNGKLDLRFEWQSVWSSQTKVTILQFLSSGDPPAICHPACHAPLCVVSAVLSPCTIVSACTEPCFRNTCYDTSQE